MRRGAIKTIGLSPYAKATEGQQNRRFCWNGKILTWMQGRTLDYWRLDAGRWKLFQLL